MIESSHQYHWLTAYTRGRMSGHRLDWNNQPTFFKQYPGTKTYLLPLTEFADFSDNSFFDLFQKDESTSKAPYSASPSRSRRDLAELFILTSAPTAKSSFKEGEIWYRSNASAGALHPLEFYLVFSGGDDLPPGLYHYDLLTPSLQRLRRKPGVSLSLAAGHDNPAAYGTVERPDLFCISALYFRTAWKYRDRAYRYLLLDCGHALENLALALKIKALDFTIELDFDDDTVNKNLRLDPQREVVLANVGVTWPETAAADLSVVSDPSDPEPELPPEERDSTGEITYPALHEIHQATSQPLTGRVGEQKNHLVIARKDASWQKIPDDIYPVHSSGSYINALRQRRSRRNFSVRGGTLVADSLFLLLGMLLYKPVQRLLLQPEIIFSSHSVDNFPDGLYLLDYERRSYALLDNRDRRRELAAAALDQRWIANAALQFIFFADLELAEKEYGPRSYRHLNINAGRLGQRLYLGATSLGLGCCAVGAFYDRDLAAVCSLQDNCDPLYMVAVGPVAGQ